MVLIIHCQCDDQTINNFPKTDYLDCFALPCLVWGSSADSGILQFSTNILENISNLRWHFYQRIALSLKLPWSDICAAWKNVDMIKPLQLFYLKLQAKMSRGVWGYSKVSKISTLLLHSDAISCTVRGNLVRHSVPEYNSSETIDIRPGGAEQRSSTRSV